MLVNKILTIGENITVRRFARYDGVVATYIHGGGRIGVMVTFTLADASKATQRNLKIRTRHCNAGCRCQTRHM